MQTGQFVFCAESVIPVREEHKDQAEIVTQLLFGEIATVTEIHQQWIKVKSAHDQYEGWIDHKQILLISPATADHILKNFERQQCLHGVLKSPWGIIHTVMGSFIPFGKKEFDVEQQRFEVLDLEVAPISKAVTSTAIVYKNAPYLWGGRTHYGIDCSGFTQAVYRFHGVDLPRDASQQVLVGKTVSFEDVLAGDVAYFHNEKGNVTHVGIILDELFIIHASGRVRIDRLTPTGIFNDETQKETHKLHSIKRFLT